MTKFTKIQNTPFVRKGPVLTYEVNFFGSALSLQTHLADNFRSNSADLQPTVKSEILTNQ